MTAAPTTPDEALDDLEIERRARDRRLARGFRLAARRALALARRYREEEGPRGQRELECVSQALAWRAAARGKLAESRPGLARTTAPGTAAAAADRRAG